MCLTRPTLYFSVVCIVFDLSDYEVCKYTISCMQNVSVIQKEGVRSQVA